jgi:hypothetical protein
MIGKRIIDVDMAETPKSFGFFVLGSGCPYFDT